MAKLHIPSRRLLAPPNIQGEKQLREWLRCSRDPVYFIHNYCQILDPGSRVTRKPFRLFGFQRAVLKEWLSSWANLVLKPRQMGISWLAAAFIVWLCIFHPDQNVMVVSINQLRAKRFLDKVKYIYRHLPAFLRCGVANSDETTGTIGTAHIIEFETGSRVESVPTTEEGPRGDTVSFLVVDEAAFVRWVDALWAALFPTLSTGGRGLIISTPNGVGDWFHQMVVGSCLPQGQGGNDFNLVKLHWRDHPLRGDEYYASQLANLGPDRCAQEVDCSFLASGRPVFSPHALEDLAAEIANTNAAKAPTAVQMGGDLIIFTPPIHGRDYVIGADTAKGDGSSFQAFVVRDRATGKMVASYRGKIPIDIYAALLLRMAKFYNMATLAVERNNTGHAVLEYLHHVWAYPNLYYMVDFLKGTRASDPGFVTSEATKRRIIPKMEIAIRRGESGILDKRLLNECWTFVYDGDKMHARAGFSDDLVMAWAISEDARTGGAPVPDELPFLAA